MTADARDILIVGGGLSGLALAARLDRAGRDYLLFEARDRLGGRVLSTGKGPAAVDLGPAWLWPGQPRIAALAQRLGLQVFDQFAAGSLRFEDAKGDVTDHPGIGSMQGSLRISGGMGALIDGLANTLPRHRLLTNRRVTALHRTPEGIVATHGQEPAVIAQRVVLALPPRIAAGISCTPTLPASAANSLRAIPTWMAGQAKAVAFYDKPFWREHGLSGDAMSQRGPLVEIHDASPADATSGALFGFVGLPPDRRGDVAALRAAVTAQLTRLFGAAAAAPRELVIRDWARDPDTATQDDQRPLHTHPHYGLPDTLQGLWDDRLIFSGAETAPGFGGYLEGALEAAEDSFQTLNRKADAA